jgi:hypothetical protein
MTGIRDTEPHVYQLTNESILPAIHAAGIATATTRASTEGQKQSVFIGAYLQFNLGSVKLLCKVPYDPDRESRSEKNAGNSGWKAGSWCVPVKADDVRLIRRNYGVRTWDATDLR